MKRQNGFTIVEMAVVLFFVAVVGSWVWNAVKLSSCDFESNYRCEAIHGVGLVAFPLSVVTVWFDDDGK